MVTSNADLILARTLSHHACQWPSLAARANLPALDDDSHSSLSWDNSVHGLVSQALTPGGEAPGAHDIDRAASGAEAPDGEANLEPYRLGFRFDRASLVLLSGDTVTGELPLAEASEADISRWADEALMGVGLLPATSAELPYDLGGDKSYAELQRIHGALAELGRGYELTAAALEHLQQTFGHLAVRPPMVRCWPHHFDLAVLFALEEGDPETAQAIGVGLSPGDETFILPYFYCSPWPAPDPLPSAAPPAPSRWHRGGFTSLVADADGLLEDPADLAAALEAIVLYARQSLEAP